MLLFLLSLSFFFFNDTATTEIYTLSLHDALPISEKRKRIALETRELYAPLAHRFGMAGVKAELEDLAFKYLEPDDYKQLARQGKSRREERRRDHAPPPGPPTPAMLPRGGSGGGDRGRAEDLLSSFRKKKKPRD